MRAKGAATSNSAVQQVLGHRPTLPYTRVQINAEYAALLGAAVYVFAYYEWTIVSILNFLEPGFVNEYSRGKPLMSGKLRERFQSSIDKLPIVHKGIDKTQFQSCCKTFEAQINRRNALIHAHPASGHDEQDQLIYQAASTKPITDMHWPTSELKAIVQQFDAAACDAAEVLDRLR